MYLISAFCSLLVSYMPLALSLVTGCRVRFPQTHYGGGPPRAPLLKSPHPGVWRSPGAVARIRASNLGLFAATARVEITDVASTWGA